MFLYEYMSEDELTIAQENAKFENELKHLDTEYAILCLEHEARLNDIETAVMMERYSEDNLVDMYSKEMATYTEAVGEWWDKFKKWLKGIVDAILGKKITVPEGEADTTIEIPLDLKEAKSTLSKITGAVKNVVNCKKPDGSFDTAKFLTMLGITAAVSTGAGFGIKAILDKKKLTTPTKVKVSDAANDCNEVIEEGQNFFNVVSNIKSNDDGILQAAKSVVTQAVNWIKQKAETVSKIIANAGSSVKKGATKLVDKAKGNQKQLEDNGNVIDGEARDVYSNNDKKRAKEILIRAAKSGNFFNKSKGNKINIDEIERLYSELKKRRADGKFQNINPKDMQFIGNIIKYMRDNNINECAIDDIDGFVFTESLTDTLENVDGFEFESFLESYDDESIDELIDLVSEF